MKKGIALVTGGSKGIGQALCLRFAQTGYHVFSASRSTKQLSDTVGITRISVDLRDGSATQSFAKEFIEQYGIPDILVNNAGITRDAPFHKMSRDQWTDVMRTNLDGVFNMTHPLWNGMRERKFGRIINISSINGQKGQFAQANYSAAKAGDIGFTKALAQEGARAGITVNAICPGYIATEMVMAVPEKVRDSIIAQIPAGRLGEAAEIARCVVFLASDDAGFITGSTMTANGGQYMT